jgi:hypothetical protein
LKGSTKNAIPPHQNDQSESSRPVPNIHREVQSHLEKANGSFQIAMIELKSWRVMSQTQAVNQSIQSVEFFSRN